MQYRVKAIYGGKDSRDSLKKSPIICEVESNQVFFRSGVPEERPGWLPTFPPPSLLACSLRLCLPVCLPASFPRKNSMNITQRLWRAVIVRNGDFDEVTAPRGRYKLG